MTSAHHELEIRRIRAGDPVPIGECFGCIGKSAELFERYLAEQGTGNRIVLVGLIEQDFAGYITVNWRPTYSHLAAEGVPELQDLNVLPLLRRRGVATKLVASAEREVKARSNVVAIAVGLHPGYNAAQRLYGRLGYVPDGKGITVREQPVCELQMIKLDDDVVLHLEKNLASAHTGSSARWN